MNLAGLTEKAHKLLEAGRAVKRHGKLTRREEEVLNGVMRSFANKEIAASLNLSERASSRSRQSLDASSRDGTSACPYRATSVRVRRLFAPSHAPLVSLHQMLGAGTKIGFVMFVCVHLNQSSDLHRAIADERVRNRTQPDSNGDCPRIGMTKHAIRKVTGPAQARLHLGRCLGTALCFADCG